MSSSKPSELFAIPVVDRGDCLCAVDLAGDRDRDSKHVLEERLYRERSTANSNRSADRFGLSAAARSCRLVAHLPRQRETIPRLPASKFDEEA